MEKILVKALIQVAGNFPKFNKMPLEDIDAILDLTKKGNERIVEDEIKKYGYSLTDLGWSVLLYLKQGDLKWEEIAILQNKYHPKGKNIIPHDWLARNIINLGLDSKVPKIAEIKR